MENEILREEEAQKIAKDLKEKYEYNKVAEMIKSNTILFSFKDNDYRVRLLNEKEKDELDLLRRAKFSSLFQAKDENGNLSFLFEKELIKQYKERGIDIEEINDKIRKLRTEIKDLQMKLGEALEKKEPDSILNTYKDEIIELEDEINGYIIQKSAYLENSFEKTLENYVIKVIAYLSLEIKISDQFVKAYSKLDDFLSAEDELLGKTIIYSMALSYGI